MSLFLLILSLVLFVGLVVVHEWGHFIAARRGGVEVEEFGIGFPPKIWGKKIVSKKSKFLFTINLLPLGGFVRLKGEHSADTRPGSFGAASLPVKIKIMLAGVLMNAVVAFFILTILAAVGMPKIIENQYTVASDTKVISQVKNEDVVLISKVNSDTPAAKAGLKEGDRVLSLGEKRIDDVNKLGELTKENAGKTVTIKVKRGDEVKNFNAQLNQESSGKGYLGVASESGASGVEVRRSTWSSPVVALGFMRQVSALTFKGIGTALTNLVKGNTEKASEQVSGPIGIFYILKEGSKIGLSFILLIIAIISLTLALINVLPIPALDGGKLFVTLIFEAMKKPLTKNVEEAIHGAGFVLLMILIILVTVVDVKRFF